MAVDHKVIVTIDREFGSGGHEVARRLAERLEVPLYAPIGRQFIAKSPITPNNLIGNFTLSMKLITKSKQRNVLNSKNGTLLKKEQVLVQHLIFL